MQDLKMPGNLTDVEKFLIDKMVRIEQKLDSYHEKQEEKITNLRVKVAQMVVIMALVSTGISVTISEYLQPAIPVERSQTKR
jgi:hypothetical protein